MRASPLVREIPKILGIESGVHIAIASIGNATHFISAGYRVITNSGETGIRFATCGAIAPGLHTTKPLQNGY
jgi:hypothetical protein